ncbi:MAG: 50S ribosomal protein L21 [Deltaproteobacteria bacterium]|nr:50S ribosomal protein L21 [Deltaproteobacteria bacterium]
MFAVIRTGGKQYRVEPDSIINIEKIKGEVGDDLMLSEVLLVDNGAEVKVGQPLVEGAAVNIVIMRHGRAKKLIAFKKIRRHGKQVKKGHRQSFTQVRVKNIVC